MKTLGDALLKPHPSYYEDLKQIFPFCKGIAHITGGGLYENIPRILPDDIQAEFDASLWDIPSIFRFIKATGSIDPDEMYKVFNMGLGMVIICSPENVPVILEKLPQSNVVGRLQRKVSEKKVNIKNKK